MNVSNQHQHQQHDPPHTTHQHDLVDSNNISEMTGPNYTKSPPLLSESKTYEDWKKKINIWNRISTLDAASKASQVFMTLKGEAEDAVMELDESEIFNENGLTNILGRLDTLYKKDATLQKVQYLEEFESYRRTDDMTILQHIVKFDQLYNKLSKYGSTLSDDILAFKLMKSANLASADEKLAKASCDMTYAGMKTMLKKIFTENSGGAAVSSTVVKLEGVHCATDEEAYYMKHRNNYSGGARPKFTPNSNNSNNNSQQRGQHSGSRRGRNPLDNSGKVMRCHHCDSINHLYNGCPDRQHRAQQQQQQQYTTNRTYLGTTNQQLPSIEQPDFHTQQQSQQQFLQQQPQQQQPQQQELFHQQTQQQQLYQQQPQQQQSFQQQSFQQPENNQTFFEQCFEIDEVGRGIEQSVVLYQGEFDENRLHGLLSESWNSAVLDCGASKTVCGSAWLENYKKSLPIDQQNMQVSDSNSQYRFGDGKKVPSLGHVNLPAVLGEREVTIGTDIVKENIPLLFSRSSMKKASMLLNFRDSTIEVFDKCVPMNITQTGHCTIPISPATQLLQRFDEEGVKITLHVKSDSPSLSSKQRALKFHPSSTFPVMLSVKTPTDKKAIAVKLHVSFAHATASQLLRFLKSCGKPWCSDTDLHKWIEQVVSECQTCLTYKRAPPRPVVGLPLATKFLQSVAMDLKFYQKKIILHLIDHATRLSVAQYIPNKLPSTIVKAIMRFWIAVFGATDQFLTDNGGEFFNEQFTELCERFNIDVKNTAAQAPWSNGMVERHHVIITHMMDKVLHDIKCDSEIALAWCVNAKNALKNVHGFSPYQLALGQNPKLPAAITDRPPALATSIPKSEILRENLNALHAARVAFMEVEHSERVKRALSHRIRTTNNNRFLNGDKVYFKREDSDEWKGPGSVIGQDGQQVLVKFSGYLYRVHTCRIRSATPRVIENTNILPPPTDNLPTPTITSTSAFETSTTPTTLMTPTSATISESQHYSESDSDDNAELPNVTTVTQDAHVQELPFQHGQIENDVPQGSTQSDKAALLRVNDMIVITTPESNDPYVVKLISLAGKRKGKYKNAWNVSTLDGTVKEIDLDRNVTSWKEVEVESTSHDELVCEDIFVASKQEEVISAKHKEMEAWREREVFKEVENKGQKTVSVKWVITKKMSESGEVVKARLVARGFEEVQNFRTDSPTISREGIRIVLTVIASKGWKLQSIDIKTAFLQGKPIERLVFLKPPREAKTDKLWQLLKCVYGLGDAPRLFYLKLSEELVNLGMIVSTYDKGLFLAFKGSELIGILGSHVDDMVFGGDENFDLLIEKLRKVFLFSTEQSIAFQYVGIQLKQSADFSIIMNQHSFASSIVDVPLSYERSKQKLQPVTDEERTNMRSAIGQLNWLAGMTRPDLSFDVCQLSSKVTQANVEDIVQLNKVIHRARVQKVEIVFPPLDLSSVQMTVYADASFNNLPNGGSQEGRIVFMSDQNNKCAPLSWGSSRIKRVVRSTLAAEAIALNNGCDDSVYLGHIVMSLNTTTPTNVLPIIAYTDNKNTIDAVNSTTPVDDRKLRVEISALRQYHETKEIEIRKVPGKENVSDVLTKRGASSKSLLSVVTRGSFH